jgi:hypothetical protein
MVKKWETTKEQAKLESQCKTWLTKLENIKWREEVAQWREEVAQWREEVAQMKKNSEKLSQIIVRLKGSVPLKENKEKVNNE